MNYAKEVIPDVDSLNNKATELIKKIATFPKYQFDDLFQKKESGEYHRNNKIWGSIFNNWVTTDQKEKNKPQNEVKGVYVFYADKKPIYVGISRGILGRMKDHFLGKTHYSASLVYLMLRDEYDRENGELYVGKRSDFKLFEDKRADTQSGMRDNWDISIIPIKDNYEMYFTEIYLACHLKTYWNSFETH
ncbi:MAG: hypothetical protein JXR07_11940 [Reichenbachiella sp.]